MNDLELMKEFYKSAIRLFPGVAPGSEGVELEEELFAEPWDCGMTKVVAQNTLVPVILPFVPLISPQSDEAFLWLWLCPPARSR